jgi:DNA invertase Pin-like site-specific DNA recombinase
MTVFAAIYQFERENTLERQAEGIAIAKREGKYKGRKPIEVSKHFLTLANAWADGKIPLKQAISESGMSESTFFRKCKQQGISRVPSSKSS